MRIWGRDSRDGARKETEMKLLKMYMVRLNGFSDPEAMFLVPTDAAAYRDKMNEFEGDASAYVADEKPVTIAMDGGAE